MRGIAMAIIGATILFIPDGKQLDAGHAIWFIATILVIIGG